MGLKSFQSENYNKITSLLTDALDFEDIGVVYQELVYLYRGMANQYLSKLNYALSDYDKALNWNLSPINLK